jgi:hypothetical protein
MRGNFATHKINRTTFLWAQDFSPLAVRYQLNGRDADIV